MQSFGSQTWDASLIIQALFATNLMEDIGPTLAKGHDFIKKSQVCLIFVIRTLLNYLL
jgi:beta-amyrin synthase